MYYQLVTEGKIIHSVDKIILKSLLRALAKVDMRVPSGKYSIYFNEATVPENILCVRCDNKQQKHEAYADFPTLLQGSKGSAGSNFIYFMSH